MKKKRLAFARKYRQWTEHDWRQVMFSDESTFALFNSRSAMVRRLISTIKTMWEMDMDIEYFRKLANSMPRRLQQVIEANGEMTKY